MRLFLRLSGRRGSSSSYSHHHHHHHHQQLKKTDDDENPGDDFEEARCCFARNSCYSHDEVLVLVLVVLLFQSRTERSRDEQEARFVCLRCDLSPGVSFRDIFLSRGIELLSLSLSLSLSLFGNERTYRAKPFSAMQRTRLKKERKRATECCSFVAQRKKRIMMLFAWEE